jgi:hypothetical protein
MCTFTLRTSSAAAHTSPLRLCLSPAVAQNDYEGDKANLGSLEQFFLCVGDVPRYEQRLISMLFKLRLDTMLAESRCVSLAVLPCTHVEAVPCVRLCAGRGQVRLPTILATGGCAAPSER